MPVGPEVEGAVVLLLECRLVSWGLARGTERSSRPWCTHAGQGAYATSSNQVRTRRGVLRASGSADIGKRAARGTAITVATQVIKLGTTLGSLAILARLLTPSDYGLLAMLLTFAAFVSVFRDFGLTSATIQRATLTNMSRSPPCSGSAPVSAVSSPSFPRPSRRSSPGSSMIHG